MLTLKELTSGMRIAGMHALCEKATKAETKAGKPYLRLTIRDKTGSVEGVMWDWTADLHPDLKGGEAVVFDGETSLYNGQLQLKFVELGLSNRSPADFARATQFSVDEMWQGLVDLVSGFEEPLTKFVTEEILMTQASMIEAFKTAPAAKGVHNAWYNGLLEHVWSLCQIAEPVIAHYRTKYKAPISRDKVLFGLMLHDAGKVFEYDYSTPAFGYTPIGTFTPHIVLGPAWVYEKANQWWAKRSHPEGVKPLMTPEVFKIERAHLMHILAAHHGRIDWGSPVKPASMEAVLVHHLDNLDSKMLHAWEFVTGKPGQVEGFSDYSRIEGTSFYQPK